MNENDESQFLKRRRDAIAIWQAGVDAVDSGRLVAAHVAVDDGTLTVCGHAFPLNGLRRIAVVGAGKAGAGMAVAVERALGEQIVNGKVSGWVNVPEGCLRPTRRVHLHPARPAGHNEPTQAGVDGAIEILNCVSELTADDLCLVLLSGGGSALLPAPVPEISLADKQAVTRLLMHAGATIDELNCVRKQLSRIKGGRLAAACNAGTTIALIVSDVIGDPLDVIASGPTVADSSTPADALAILEKYTPDGGVVPAAVLSFLESARDAGGAQPAISTAVHNHVIGNNAVAVDAAANKARELGYAVESQGSDNAGIAAELGRELADRAIAMRNESRPGTQPRCLLSGGEPVVQLVATDRPRKGGRNQELVLAAVERLWNDGMAGVVVLSGGTDGEDGPTDAAGAWADAGLLAEARKRDLQPGGFLAINNSYPFFQQTGGLLMTGPTHTNVMDLRVVLAGE